MTKEDRDIQRKGVPTVKNTCFINLSQIHQALFQSKILWFGMLLAFKKSSRSCRIRSRQSW
jgi:hypothetical protein